MKIALFEDSVKNRTIIRMADANGPAGGYIRDIDAPTLARWRKVMAAFDQAQKEMLKAIEEGA